MRRYCFGNQLDWLGDGPEASRVHILRFELYDEALRYLRSELGLIVRVRHAHAGTQRGRTARPVGSRRSGDAARHSLHVAPFPSRPFRLPRRVRASSVDGRAVTGGLGGVFHET